MERGSITIAGERIVALNSNSSGPVDLDLDDVAVLPGLVNAHTHLDLSFLRGQAPPTRHFVAWLRAIVELRRSLTPEQIEAGIRAGIAESISHGTTLVGDIAGLGLSRSHLVESPLWSVVFYELIGLPLERVESAWQSASVWLSERPPSDRCRSGLSPHAPYSVRTSLFQKTATAARQCSCPIAIHIAESKAEEELLRAHTGALQALLSDLNVWDADGLVPSWDVLLTLYRDVVSVALVHGNYLDPGTPLPHGASIVYCPRTHAAFGHAPHPFRDFLARGVRVALGTDSLASNPDLDLLAEAHFVRRLYPDVPGDVILKMATLAGAEVLGFGDTTGSLEPGKSADLVIVPIEERTVRDPYSLVLDADCAVRAVLWRGQWVHGKPTT